MRKSVLCLSILLLSVVAGCVTINVYFPEAAAEKAADQFVGSVIGPGNEGAPAHGASTPASATSTPAKPSASASAGRGHGKPLAVRVLTRLVPAARAADRPNLRIHSAEIDAIHARMRERYRKTMHGLLDAGFVGFTHDGLVAVHGASDIPLARRATINNAVAADNRDRKALYDAIAEANGHPEWTSKIRDIFAKIWIRKAHDGWYYQSADGAWKRK